MRKALGVTLAASYQQNADHHLFCGDIGYGVFDDLRAKTPGQFHNFGISEQHMVSYAAAFATALETTSMVYTINPFITSRVHDQLRVDVAYAKAPLIICSVGAGFAYDSLGFTHYGIEDLALLSVLPNFRIYTPSDAADVRDILSTLFSKPAVEAPCYLRLQKGGERNLSADFPDFTHHGSYKRWEGSDIEIITHGAIAEEALEARKQLAGTVSVGVRAVIDWHAYLAQGAKAMPQAKRVIFLEENRPVGSLANAIIASTVQSGQPLPPIRIQCVTEAEFTTTVLRNSALKINKLDAQSLIQTIKEMTA